MSSNEDFAAYAGKEALWHGRWVVIEVADAGGADVTDQDGGNHSVTWSALDVIGVSP